MAALNRPRTFVAAFLGLIAFVMAATAAVNVIVDPFWRFDLVNIPGFNAQRPQFAPYSRLAKAGVVCRIQPTTVILGTSRVEVGIDPKHPGFRDVAGPTYNLALAGSGLHELDLTFRHAVHASPRLKRVLLGLDFLMFNANREAVVFGTEVFNFDAGRLLLTPGDSCLRSLLHDIDGVLGRKALIFSAATMTGQIAEPSKSDSPDVAKWLAIYDRDGFRPNFSVLDKVQVPRRGYRGLYGDAQERHYSGKVWRPAPEQRYCFVRPGQPSTFETFGGMLRFARAAGVDLRIFINPVHARLLVALRDSGLWPLYEDWKRGMVDVLAAEAAASGKPQFPLWDFSGINSVTTERIPPEGDTTTIMTGFWEPSHYKKEAGDMMLDRMLGYSDPARSIPPDFGKLLTPDMIDDWISQSRAGLRDYMRAEPAEAALVNAVVDKVMAGAQGANCGSDVQMLREASAAQKRGDAAAAETAFARAEELHEADRRRYAEIGVPYRENGFPQMLAQARAGIELMPPLPTWQAYQERGIERSKTGDYRGAADDFATAIRIGPVNTALHFLRGVALLNAKDYGAAAAEFEQGLRLEPKNAALANLLKQAQIGGR